MLVFIEIALPPEAEIVCQRVSIADRKVFAPPESFARERENAYD